MGTCKFRRKTAGVNFRILFDGVENDGVVDGEEASRPRLVFEVRVSFLEASEPAMGRNDGSGVLLLYAAKVANGCHRSGAAAPLVEDDSST